MLLQELVCGDLPLREVRAQPLNAIADSELFSLEWSRRASCDSFAKERRTESGRILSPDSCPQAISASTKNCCPFIGIVLPNFASSFCLLASSFPVPRFRETVPIDDYVLDVLMRDLVGHDQKPAAFMVYLHLYGQAARNKWRHISASVRTIADATGLSKSAVHAALTHLRRRQLIATTADHVTATPRHRLLRHWRTR